MYIELGICASHLWSPSHNPSFNPLIHFCSSKIKIIICYFPIVFYVFVVTLLFFFLFLLASSRGSGKHPQLVPSTPRWAVANGAGVILSVCDDEVARNETAILTAAAVPALLLPPPTTSLDEHLVAGLPALEPYARLFHRLFSHQYLSCYLVVHSVHLPEKMCIPKFCRYYAIATPSATQRLLLGLLEAPPSWAPDALDAAVQLVELLRAAEEYASGIRVSIIFKDRE
jgi:GIGANTEA protein